MRSRRIAVWVLLLVLVGVAGWWLPSDAPAPDPNRRPNPNRKPSPQPAPPLPPVLAGRGESAPLSGEEPGPPNPADATDDGLPEDVPAMRGRVVSADGHPLGGVKVSVRREGGGHWVRPPETDAQGRYRVKRCKAGTYRAYARVNGYGTGAAGPLEVGPEGGAAFPDIVLRGEGTVAGIVLFPDGTPADDIAVGADVRRVRGRGERRPRPPGLPSASAWTDAEGRFRITGLRPGPLTVEAPDMGDGKAFASAESGDTDVRLVIRCPRTHVRIRDEHGRPIRGADLGIRYVREGRSPIGRMSVARENAAVNLWQQPGIRLVLIGHAEGRVPQEVEYLVRRWPWSRTVDLVLRADSGARGRVRIRLVGPEGARVAAFTTTFSTPIGRSTDPGLRRGKPDAEGTVRNLPVGRWHMTVWPDDSVRYPYEGYSFPVRQHVVVRADETTDVDLAHRQGGRVRVTLELDPEVPADDIEPVIRFEHASLVEPYLLYPSTDESELSQLLQPGIWVLHVGGEGVKPARHVIEVPVRTTVDLEVPLR